MLLCQCIVCCRLLKGSDLFAMTGNAFLRWIIFFDSLLERKIEIKGFCVCNSWFFLVKQGYENCLEKSNFLAMKLRCMVISSWK